jgi:hypothetical protein
VSATVQPAKSSTSSIRRATPLRLGALFSVSLVAGLFAVLWWTTSGREYIVRSVDPFRATGIDLTAGTLSMVHGNRRYVVRCDSHCGGFKVGGLYRMHDAGAALEYAGGVLKITLPIIEEQTTFDVTGGHG